MSDASLKQGPSKIASLLILVSAVIVPIFMLPGVVDPGNWQKRILMSVVTLALVALWIIQSLLSKRTFFTLSRTSLLFLGFAGVSIVSSLLTNNALYHLTNFPVTWLSLALFVLFGSTLGRSLRWSTMLRALLVPATILVAVALLQLTPLALSEILNNMFGTNYAKTIGFSLADSLLGMLTFVIPVALASLLHTGETEGRDENPMLYKVWSGVLLIAAIGLAIAGWTNPATRPFILPWSAGWTIAVETLKTPRSLLLGFGPQNFLNAFHQFRGLQYNTLDFWTVRFASSSSEFLFLLTTTGLLGVGMLLAAAKSAMPMIRTLRARHFSLVVYMALHGLAFLALPFTPVLWFTLALGLMMVIREAALARNEEVWVFELPTSARSPWLTPAIASGLIGGAVALAAVFMVAPLRSNYLLGWSLKQAATADAQTVYNAQAQAMNLTPFHPEYRRAFASTSFAIIQAMGQQAQTSGTQLTAEQNELSLQLLQQALTEARNAVALDPASTESWELLGNIYANVLTVEGAADWAVAARTQAIQTDPTSPELRVALGQLYGQLSQPQNALQFYEQAVQLNPRWVQPYYMFGETALVLENGQAAAVAFQKTLELLDPAAQERAVVQDKLKAAIELAEKQAAEASAAAAKAQAEQDALAGAPGDTPQQFEAPTQPTQPDNPEVDPQPAGFEELL
jgi:tetratricopeptide (TPR) repeat protein